MSIADMGLVLYMANEGYLQDVEINKINDFEAALLSFARSEYADMMSQVDESAGWNKDIEAQFKACIEKFKSTQTW